MFLLRAQNGGFTLVEVLAATVLLSIGLMGILAANQAAQETQRKAVYLSIGRNIAQSKIEELRYSSIDSLGSSTSNSQNSSLPRGNSISTSVAPYPNSSSTDLYKAEVTVSWPEGSGVRRICYETLISRK